MREQDVAALGRYRPREVYDVLFQGRLTRGLHLRLSQVSLGRILDVSEQGVALWEKRGRVPRLADKHLRLFWIEKHNGNEPIVRAMNRLNEVERLVNQKIVARESRAKGWTTRSGALEA